VLRNNYALLLLSGLRHPRAAEEQMRLVVSRLPYSPRHCQFLGESLRGQGRFDEAIALFQRALETGAERASLHADLAMAYAGKQDYQQAERHFSKSLDIDPFNPKTYYDLSEAIRRQGEADRAMEILRAGLQIAPDHAMLHYNLARCLVAQGDTRAAIEELRVVLSIDSRNQLALELLKTLEN
jgi:tetratricopeptide (TPR) repeat protein